MGYFLVVASAIVFSAFSSKAHAQVLNEPADEPGFGISGQTTWINQRKASLKAAYTGPNSLIPAAERSYSFTASAALAWRAGNGLSFELHPEAAQGVPLSKLTGFGGFPNNELARTSGSDLTVYRARAFARKELKLEDDSRVVITLGNLSVIDLFDQNQYSHDPRRQFLNWSLVTHGAYDYAADARGYSWGGVVEYITPKYAIRFGRFIQPVESNGLRLNRRILSSYGDQLELERSHKNRLGDAKTRWLVFRNQAVMGRFDDAIAAGNANNTSPAVSDVRTNQAKIGIGMALEQNIGNYGGVFARASMHDGKTETYSFTEIDRSVSLGFLANGNAWTRSADSWGAALVMNGLSKTHQQYLRAGGLGFFLGDGNLSYKPEKIVEVFYSVALPTERLSLRSYLTFNFQRIENPGYNSVRGPASILGARLHANF
jgi:high affinity Mn2+ porin